MTLPLHKQAFSLVETLVVLTIMSVLAVLTMSSFSSLRSTSLTASGNQLVDVFAMARQNSIAKNAFTAVVIKKQGTGAYSAYCLLELIQPDDGSAATWNTLTPWRYLGQGVVFESGQTGDTFTSTLPSLPKSLPSSFPFQGQSIDLTSTTVYQCYQPDGTLLGGQNPPIKLRLMESAGPAANYYDLVFIGNTGVTKIERP